MSNNKQNFEILSTCQISSNKQIVVSKNSYENDDIVIAQRMVVEDDGRERHFYEKGTIIIRNEYEDQFKEMLQNILDKLKK